MQSIEIQLTGGHPNSLGNTIEVVEQVLEDPDKMEELFQCYFSEDEVVRLRVSNAMKRITKADKELVIPYLARFLDEISNIDQASTQWTLAQLFLMLEKHMTEAQIQHAKDILMDNLNSSDDWIVLNMTMETLAKWAMTDEALKIQLLPRLKQLEKDPRKSVFSKASKKLAQLT